MPHQHISVPGSCHTLFPEYVSLCVLHRLVWWRRTIYLCARLQMPSTCPHRVMLGLSLLYAAMTYIKLLLPGLPLPVTSHTAHGQPEASPMDTAISASAGARF